LQWIETLLLEKYMDTRRRSIRIDCTIKFIKEMLAESTKERLSIISIMF
jgi:hypothetical protein